MQRAVFAIPGDLGTLSGGYGYARRVLRGAGRAGVALEHLALGAGFPDPTDAALAEASRLLAAIPPDSPVLIDGLAYGAFPDEVVAAIRAPVVALCHHPLALETGLAEDRAAELEATETAALEAADAVVTTSHATRRILNLRYGVPEGKMTVAPPGTDPAPRAAGSGGGGRDCRIVSVGAITPRKGHVRLVRALAGLGDARWSLRIIGPAPDPATLAALEGEIARYELGDRICLAGPLGVAEVAAAYQGADLFVLASEYEGFGMAFAEAMANGLPVLGLHCPAVEEATLGAARLVAPDEFPDALEDLVRRPVSRALLAESCWEAAASLPRWPDSIGKIAGALRSVA